MVDETKSSGGDGTEKSSQEEGSRPPVEGEKLEALLGYIKRSRGFDFTGYKRTSLERRIRKRLQDLNMDAFEPYIDYLEVHPQEFEHLFNTVLINVTGFFRDEAAWAYIGHEIIPRILANREPHHYIRVWCAGTASGEEAYSIAMLLCEAMGDDTFRERVKIYATDVDEEALIRARAASYSDREVIGIPAELLARYFEHTTPMYVFRKDLRRAVIFGRHDLVQDAPISRIALLICRNTLMYFNAETQSRILARFHFALDNNGFLFLGRAEMLFTHANLFIPTDLRWRVFSKVNSMNLRDRMLRAENGANDEAALQLGRHMQFREIALDASPLAQLAVDLNGIVVLANERARTLFGLTSRDLGRPVQDLDLSYRLPGLRAAIERAYNELRPHHLKEVEYATTSGDIRHLEPQITPLIDATGTLLGAGIMVADVTDYRRLQEEIEHTNQELETAYEELQSTNEELETTNEELQSTVEELETTNEELQSTNEELETMNEELQSTNEELQTVNDEGHRRTEALQSANRLLVAVLSSLQAGVIVLDRDLRVRAWNRRSEEQWGLRAQEANGQHIMNLEINLPLDQLRADLRSCLNGECTLERVVLTGTNRRGQPTRYEVTCTPLAEGQKTISGLVLLVEEADAAGEEQATDHQ